MVNACKEILTKAQWCWKIYNLQKLRGQFIMLLLAIICLLLQFDNIVPNILEVLKISLKIGPINDYIKLILFLISGNIIWQLLLSIKDNKRTIVEEILIDCIHNKFNNYDKEIKDFFENYENQRAIINFIFTDLEKNKINAETIKINLIDALSEKNYVVFCICLIEFYKEMNIKLNISFLENKECNIVCSHPHYIFLQKELLHKNLDNKIEQKTEFKKIVKIVKI